MPRRKTPRNDNAADDPLAPPPRSTTRSTKPTSQRKCPRHHYHPKHNPRNPDNPAQPLRKRSLGTQKTVPFSKKQIIKRTDTVKLFERKIALQTELLSDTAIGQVLHSILNGLDTLGILI